MRTITVRISCNDLMQIVAEMEEALLLYSIGEDLAEVVDTLSAALSSSARPATRACTHPVSLLGRDASSV
jgi:hypothetical protein